MMTNKEMNQAIKVRIKNAHVRKSEIDKLLRHWEEIDRDVRTYEILAGGNTYLFVEYECGIIEDAAADLVPISEKVLANPEKYSGHRIVDNGKKLRVFASMTSIHGLSGSRKKSLPAHIHIRLHIGLNALRIWRSRCGDLRISARFTRNRKSCR